MQDEHTKSIVFSYTSTRDPGIKTKITMSFTIAQKLKYLVVSPTKCIQDLYVEKL